MSWPAQHRIQEAKTIIKLHCGHLHLARYFEYSLDTNAEAVTDNQFCYGFGQPLL